MKRFLLSFFLMMAWLSSVSGQMAGQGVYSFLQLTYSAREAALGGIQVALPGADPELVLRNPALLSSGMDNTLSVGYAAYLAGIGFGQAAFAKDLGKYGMAAAGIRFADYGQFTAADETGVITGSFGASDYALTLTWGKSFDSLFTVAASLKPIYSHLENYRSFGIAADLGIVRHTADHLTTLALCVQNIGSQLTTYYDGGPRERTSWSLQAGVSHLLKYAPLLLCLTAYDLNDWHRGVSLTDPNGIEPSSTGQSVFSAVMRHLALGAEIFPENRVTFRLGYNYRRHEDLQITGIPGMAGISAGLGISLAAIRFSYSISGYAQGGTVQNFSMSANLAKLH